MITILRLRARLAAALHRLASHVGSGSRASRSPSLAPPRSVFEGVAPRGSVRPMPCGAYRFAEARR